MARQRKVRAEKENGERWLLTYADMITLLMTFFVVLYSMSKTDVAKFEQMSQALERAFSVEVLQGTALGSTTAGGGANPSIVQSLFTEPEFASHVARIQQRLEQASAAVGDDRAPSVSIGATHEGIVIRLSGSYLFDSGRAELKPMALWQLDAIAAEIRGMGNDVRVEGHTDSIPVDSPRYPTNWELSVARAVAVSRYLIEAGSVPPARIAAAGFGEYRPVADNATALGRRENRRVEIRILTARPLPTASATPDASQAGPTGAPGPAHREVSP